MLRPAPDGRAGPHVSTIVNSLPVGAAVLLQLSSNPLCHVALVQIAVEALGERVAQRGRDFVDSALPPELARELAAVQQVLHGGRRGNRSRRQG